MTTDRRETVRALIEDRGEVQLKELQEVFPQVSTMTLRRDLTYLEDKGYVIRTRGGAVSVNRLSMAGEAIFNQRVKENINAKIQVAKKAAELVESGRSMYLDSGTTMMYLAKSLPDDHLSIITSGPNIALEIIKKQKPSVTLIGGQLSRNNLSISGIHSMDFINSINIDMAFLATSGFSLESGFTGGNYEECQLKERVIEKARKTIMVMDASKMDKNMPFTFASLDDIDVLICDAELPLLVVQAAQEKKVEIITVG